MAVLWRFEEVPLPSDQSHVTNRLAPFVAGSQWETIPSEVRREGVRGLLNFVGCALGGAQDEAMGIAVNALQRAFLQPCAGIPRESTCPCFRGNAALAAHAQSRNSPGILETA